MTVLFSDVAGSTELGERLDPEAVRGVMNRYFTAVSAALERHGGRLEKFIGDAVVGLFGVPVAHEDDALRCVRAALEARDGLAALGDELEATLGVRLGVRIGIATGEVVIGSAPGGHLVATGDTMNTAARLEAAAPVGGILLGAATHRLVREAVEAEPLDALALKGKAESVAAFRLVGLRGGAAARPRPAGAAMVGRVRERRMLRDAFDRAAEERSCQLVTVLGTAGVGKSRLVGEFLASVEGAATTAAGRCLSYGEGITFWALAEAVRGLAGIEEGDSADGARARLAAIAGAAGADEMGALLGLAGATGRVDDARVALRRMLEAAGRDRPLVLVLDDIQWAEPPLLDLIDYLADWLTETSVLLVCMARPELLEARPGWAGGKLNATSLLLEPLADADCDLLVRDLLGDAVPVAVADRIRAVAEGNPLFVEELIGMLADDGHLVRAGERIEMVGTIDRVELPATIQALLTARLDRLSADELGIVERASIEGQVFHAGALAALGADAAVTRVTIPVLARKQLLRSEPAALPGQDAYRFRHLLIREAAYERIAKQVRAEWHEAFADWLEALAGERASEYEELLAHHLAEAFRCRRDIGAQTPQADALGRRGANLYRRAADRAVGRGDFRVATTLLAEIDGLLPAGELDAALALADRAWWLASLGLTREAEPVCETARSAAGAAGDDGVVLYADAVAGWIRLAAAVDGDIATARAELERMRQAAEGLDADRQAAIAARVWILVAEWAMLHLLRCGDGLIFARRARAYADTSEVGWLQFVAANIEIVAAMRGRGPISELIADGERLISGVGRAGSVDLLLSRATLRAQQGDIDAARADLAAAEELLADLGWNDEDIGPLVGLALLDAGDPAGAAARLAPARDSFLAWGDRAVASSCSAALALALVLTGRHTEAGAESDRARELASRSDIATQLFWRGAKARALGADGETEAAAALAGEIVSILDGVDYPQIEFHARLGAAEGYRAAGRLDEAEALLRRALADSDERGAHGFARLAHEALDGLTAPA